MTKQFNPLRNVRMVSVTYVVYPSDAVFAEYAVYHIYHSSKSDLDRKLEDLEERVAEAYPEGYEFEDISWL